jgi:hypothetical protein
MKNYFNGYYCRDDLHLQILNKDSNRKILEALRESYPEGLTVEELAKKTKLPIKTIYAQKAELYREYYINHLENEKGEDNYARRGRPPSTQQKEEALRKRVRIVIEETNGIHDPFNGTKPIPLPPGNVVYSEGFTDLWNKIVEKDEEDLLCDTFLKFIQRLFYRTREPEYLKKNEGIIKKWIPEKTIEFCCTQCGVNHEARDFIRAILLHLIDKLEKNSKFIDFLKDNYMLTQEMYKSIQARESNKDNR